jgi:hypothetical protein
MCDSKELLKLKSLTYTTFILDVVYVVKDLVIMVTYRDTLEHILVINLVNLIYVVKDLVTIIAYRHILKHILVINPINMINHLPHISHL